MPRRIIKRYLPDHNKLCGHKHLRILGPLLENPFLLHLNKRSVSGAFAVGLFIAWVPVPFQMALSALAAILVRVNLPISVVLVWISNPITMPPLFYFAYKLGAWTLGVEPNTFDFELSFEWLGSSLSAVWQPFLLGCFIMGSVSSLIGGLLIRGLWRFHVVQRWKERKAKRQLRESQS